ncbi:MAG: hypothetical protein M3Y17_12105 [Actinomycetota bacterium]|nr:hypothetical protein [Actinomycetota bacterium]
MPRLDDRYIVAPTLSEAWLDVVVGLIDAPDKKQVHLIARISAGPARPGFVAVPAARPRCVSIG